MHARSHACTHARTHKPAEVPISEAVPGITLDAFTYPECLKTLVTLESVSLFPHVFKAKLKGLCPK